MSDLLMESGKEKLSSNSLFACELINFLIEPCYPGL